MASWFKSPKSPRELSMVQGKEPAEPAESKTARVVVQRKQPAEAQQWPTVPMRAEVRARWKMELAYQAAELQDEGVKEAMNTRECHPLERFHFFAEEKNVGIKVVFQDSGDLMTHEMEQRLKENLELLKSVDFLTSISGWGQDKMEKFQRDTRLLNLDSAQLQGAQFPHAQLQGAHFAKAHLQGANFSGAQLQGVNFAKAQLQQVRFEGANLEGANLQGAQLHGAVFDQAQLQGADFEFCNLTGTVLNGAMLTDATFDGAEWSKEHPPFCSSVPLCMCEPLPEIRFPKQKQRQGLFQNLLHYLKKSEDGDDEEDPEEDDDDEGKGEGEGTKDGRDDDNDEGPQHKECCVPLLKLRQDSSEFVTTTAQDAGDALAEDKAMNIDEQLADSAEKAKKHLEQLNKKSDAPAKAQVELLKKMTEKMESNAVKKLGEKDKEKLNDAMDMLSQLPSTEEGIDDFNQIVDKLRKELDEVEGAGVSSMLAKLANAQLQSATSYSSGEWLAFLKCSPAKMATDTLELEDIVGYLEKLQDTVNANNWDDIVDNFMCMYNLRRQLKGERSRSLFKSIWRDEEFRMHIAVADLFHYVKRVSDPPEFVIYYIKQAVGHVKKNAQTWKIASKKEIAAINILKSRQESFFQLCISGITGFFVFLATLLSGLLLDKLKAGRLEVPGEPAWMAGFLNLTNPS